MAVLWHPEQGDAAGRSLREMTAGDCLSAELCFSHLLLVNLILGFSPERESPTQQQSINLLCKAKAKTSQNQVGFLAQHLCSSDLVLLTQCQDAEKLV